MGARSGIALKALQWFIRAVQFLCAALVLGVFSYFLATLSNHNLGIATWVRAVEGISGAAVLYTLLGLLFLCCLAGHPVTSFIAIVLDIAFVGAFVYVAVANRGGASSCTGTVSTPYGTGNADTGVPSNGGGHTVLPDMRQACKLETACFAVSIAAIIFFIFSALLEFALVRHRRKEKRFGPGPANNYTSGYGSGRRRWGMFGRRGTRRTTDTIDPNALPKHPQPNDVRESYATEQTRVGAGSRGSGAAYGVGDGYAAGDGTGLTGVGGGGGGGGGGTYGKPARFEPGYGGGNTAGATTAGGVAPAQYSTANYRYDDGVYNPV